MIGGVRVQVDPEVGRYRPGSRPDRLEPGQIRWHRLPNGNGGGVAVHPSETEDLVRCGIPFAAAEPGGPRRVGRVYYVERQAFVDVLHFAFVERS